MATPATTSAGAGAGPGASEDTHEPLVPTPVLPADCLTVEGVLGNDLTVVNAARVSMHKRSEEVVAKDGGLIRYLDRHEHWTPFSHVMVTLVLRMPIFIARQWFKHCIGATRNEVSRRYVKEDPTFWRPPAGWRAGSADIKQGSVAGTNVDSDGALMTAFDEHCAASTALYKRLLAEGACAEQARSVLPQAMMTEFWETGSLMFYARVCNLRCAPDAQEEVRIYANAVDKALCAREDLAQSWGALRKKWASG